MKNSNYRLRIKLTSGQSLIELLIVIGILAILIPAISTGFISTREGKPQQEKRLEAANLLKETQEALRVIRETNWSSIAVNGTYHPQVTDGSWTLASNPETINGITRQIEISNVFRDSTHQIVTSGGTLDPSTKKIDISISWSDPIPASLNSTMYLTRFMDNAVYLQTTQADFDAGIKTNVAVTNTNGGEVVLASGGNGDWCTPAESVVEELNLPGNGSARDVKAIQGRAFTGTSQSSGGSFIDIGIDDNKPPTANVQGSVGGYATNDVFISGNYAFIATQDTSRDIVIINLTTHQEVGYFNDPEWLGTAQGVFVIGNVGYAAIGPRLHTFDLSSKNGSRPQLDSLLLDHTCFWIFCLYSTAYRLEVVGSYAYVAVDWGSAEFQIINVSNPRDLRTAGKADLNSQRGQEISVNSSGTRAYVATSKDNNKDEFFIIDITNKNSNNLPIVGSYDAGGMDPNGVTIVTGNRAILVGTGAEEYQVVDITNENDPVRCGGMNINTGIYGVSAVLESDGDAYSYIVTQDSSDEFKIILGGPGGSFYTGEGTYESAIFNPGFTTAFNRFMPTAVKPINTNITYQIAVADAVDGSCNSATYTYVGPDGTGSSYFNDPQAIALNDNGSGYENPGRCFRYKAYLSTTDTANTPVLQEIEVNYSP